ncbi:peptide-methionine (S)-S-oxide reductase MsrA [Halopseudomonas salegens]|uniref:Peptide methionine sulfoxide reductase MsrA n=1 Tax=Halopseudomonas salegens TaxID=1434072 RepID=A0A1H2G4M0_9GAMM|nr:peptide-methionine (S)-S-oxide reductase MsrA [Halopseudomonas salegens]SDU14553.1 peptide-methionine (S)-S-oxide reductase [Halopseudomonas salegens]
MSRHSGFILLCLCLAFSVASHGQEPLQEGPAGTRMAVFAGGCFWCTEADFDKMTGVVDTVSGYIGGNADTATYPKVSAGGTGHIEAVAVFYDPQQTDYATLLEQFWPTIDPLTDNAQFCDKGAHYRSALFYKDEEQQALITASRDALADSGRFEQPIVTDILPQTAFYPAEEYHQNYYQKNPLRYNFYRSRCGRDARLAEVWGD